MQYCIINNDIALLMHYRALLQMPEFKQSILGQCIDRLMKSVSKNLVNNFH